MAAINKDNSYLNKCKGKSTEHRYLFCTFLMGNLGVISKHRLIGDLIRSQFTEVERGGCYEQFYKDVIGNKCNIEDISNKKFPLFNLDHHSIIILFGMWNWSDGKSGKEVVIKMALCKCKACPRQGKYQVGKYYNWYFAPGQSTHRDILPDNLRVKGVHDDDNKFIQFSPGQYSLYFKDVQHADILIFVYIDRKNELLLAPEFTDEKGFGAKLSYFTKLPLPYTEDQIGRGILKVWEEYKDHPIVSTKEKEEAIPYYKIVTKGKGFRAFASGRWMIEVEFFTSENEMLLTYWYKCSNGFEIHTSDPHIQRIVPISASFEEIGHAILSIYEEAGII